LGNIIAIILTSKFKTFNIDCAGKNSPEILAIEKFIEEKYKLQDAEDADLEIYIGKTNNLWEIAIRATTRPLSVRDYKIKNIKGGMNATIAYTINSTIDLNLAKSYLNIFSGSATLPIEACGINPKMEIFGFDINKEHVSLSIQNIRKAGFIRNINLKVSDIFTNPNFGKFDVIVSDLPFGMQISKGEDLNKLYSHFIKYCEEFLNEEGKLVVYTSEFEILEKVLSLSKFKIIKTLNLKLPTSINSYLYPKIFVCEF
jgi:23S rRNA G2445 N2-methylase RlmL